MKTKFQKAAASLLAAVMLAGVLTACGSSGTSGSAAASTGSGSTASAEKIVDGSFTEPTTISYAVMADSAQKFGEGQSYDKNVWTDLIKEKLNIDLTIDWSADNTSGAYGDKLNMVVASGELPDVFTAYYSQFKTAMESGMLADLTDAVEQYGSDRLKQLIAENQSQFDACTIDGKLYALPQVGDVDLNASQLWIRQDWLKNVGLDAPTTWDELVEVARAFTFDDPDGNGVDDTYGLGLIGDLKWGGVGYFDGIASAFHAYGNDTWIRTEDGEIAYGAVQPEMKEALAATAALYEEGLIDPEFASKNTDMVCEDILNNKIGMFFGANYAGYWPLQTLVDQNPDAIFLPYAYVSADDQLPDVTVWWPVTYYQCVSADCENPEAAVLMANLYLETLNDDSDAETIATYDYSGDVSAYMLSPIRLTEPGFEFRITDAIDKALAGDTSGITGKAEMYWEKVQGYENGDASCYNYWSQVGPQGSCKVIEGYKANDQVYLTWMRGGEPEGFESIASTLKDKETEYFVNIIVGARSIDEFDTFVEEWYAEGGTDYTAAMNEQYGSITE